MKSKALLVVMMLLAISVIVFIAAPVFSGEHPWDSDYDGDGDILGPDIYDPFYTGDTSSYQDTILVGGTESVSPGGSLWTDLLVGAVSSVISII